MTSYPEGLAMSIQPENNLHFHPRWISRGNARSADDLPQLPGSGEAGAFSRILKELAASPSVPTQASSGEEVPLDKEKLLQLVQWIHIRMNERLLQSAGDGGMDVSYRWKFDGFPGNPAMWENTSLKETGNPGAAGRSPGEISPSSVRYEEIIRKAAAANDVDPDLIRGVIQVESGFNASARSPKGAMGLMQLMPGTARELGVSDPYDPEANVMGGTRYLKKLLNRYDGNVSLALAAYNWGMGNLESRRDRMPEETRNYISRITRLYDGQKRHIS